MICVMYRNIYLQNQYVREVPMETLSCMLFDHPQTCRSVFLVGLLGRNLGDSPGECHKHTNLRSTSQLQQHQAGAAPRQHPQCCSRLVSWVMANVDAGR